MASEILLALKNGRLVPVDDDAIEFVRAMGEGEVIKAKVTRPRNVKHHRMFFAVLNLIFEHQQQYATRKHLLDALKMSIGHFDTFKSPRGREFHVPRSIDFSSMDQAEFKEFFERAIHVITTVIVPQLDKESLINELNAVLEGDRYRSPEIEQTTDALKGNHRG